MTTAPDIPDTRGMDDVSTAGTRVADKTLIWDPENPNAWIMADGIDFSEL